MGSAKAGGSGVGATVGMAVAGCVVGSGVAVTRGDGVVVGGGGVALGAGLEPAESVGTADLATTGGVDAAGVVGAGAAEQAAVSASSSARAEKEVTEVSCGLTFGLAPLDPARRRTRGRFRSRYSPRTACAGGPLDRP